MTIALGFHLENGILLAADRQVTQGDMKVGAGKIALWYDQDPSRDGYIRGKLAITGAGDVHCLSAVSLLFREPFTKRTPPLTLDELQAEFEKILMSYYQEHIIPFGADGADEPQFIVAAERGGQRRMWVIESGVVVETRKPTAVGSGGIYADELFQSGHAPDKTTDMVTAQIIASYILFRVKQVAEGCGHDSDLEILTGEPNFGQFDHSGVRELEELFRRYSRTEGQRFHAVFGSRGDSSVGIDEASQELKQDLIYLLAEYWRAGFSPDMLQAQRRSRRVPLNQ
jgi:hypothetical protein